jgi:hypothetical protein
MAFELGKGRKNYMTSGQIKTKLSFNKEGGDTNVSVPGTPVIRKPLEEGIMGEANMDGSIFISDKIVPGSDMERQVINHEMRHATDMKIGKIFSGGASDLVKNVGGVIDNLHTSKEEKLEAEKKIKDMIMGYEAEMQKQVTERWKVDMNSDSWLSKNIRPLVLIFLVVATVLMIFIDAGVLAFEVKDTWVDLLQLVLITVIGAYFGGRSLEKVKK